MPQSAVDLEERLRAISFDSTGEVPGIVEIVRVDDGWAMTEYLTDDSDDALLTGEVRETRLTGHLHAQLADLWPGEIGALTLEGLDLADAVQYVASADIPAVQAGGGIRINGTWCEPDGTSLVPDPEE